MTHEGRSGDTLDIDAINPNLNFGRNSWLSSGRVEGT